MKFILLGILVVAMSIHISCSKESEPTHTDVIKSRNGSTLYHIIGGNGFVVLLKTQFNAQADIYILSTTSNHSFQQNLLVKSIHEISNGLDIELDSGGNIRWTLGSQEGASYVGYGLSKVSGDYYHPFFYGSSGPLPDPRVQEVSCKCRANIEKPRCDHGGKGSTECSIEHGGTLVGSGIQMKCNVKCEPGYYACCKNI